MTRARPWIVAGAIVLLVVLASALPVGDWSRAGVALAADAGWKGAVVYGLACVAAIVLCVPGSILTLGAGFLYGPVVGVLVISPASVLGATLAFVLARTLLRAAVETRIAKRPVLAALDGAVRERAFSTVLLLRLSPLVPFNVLNYALGITPVGLGAYVLASFAGMLPATIAYVALGALAPDVASLGSGDAASRLRVGLLVLGVAATLAVSLLLARAARRELAKRGAA